MKRSSTNFLAEFGNFHSGFQVTKKWASSEPSDADIAMAGDLKVDIDKVFVAAD